MTLPDTVLLPRLSFQQMNEDHDQHVFEEEITKVTVCTGTVTESYESS